MATAKYVNVYAMSRYTIASQYTELDLGPKGGFSEGVVSKHKATVHNLGTIGGYGVELEKGGSVQNGSAQYTYAEIFNYGVLISGGAGSVANFGTITSPTNYAVELVDGGSVTNGSPDDTFAVLDAHGGVGIPNGVSTVANFGAILGGAGNGVSLTAGGEVTNGSASDPLAAISGSAGISVGGTTTIINFGALTGFQGPGAFMSYGSVVNGSASDSAAVIAGNDFGVYSNQSATVVNFGSISQSGTTNSDAGVELRGGAVTNGSEDDRRALISGEYGVNLSGVATVANFGRIVASGSQDYGVRLEGGGSLTNGAADDVAALIEGERGLGVYGAGGAVNFATISGLTFGGVRLGPGASIVNGAADDKAALIEGYSYGLFAFSSATVTNFGTIAGAAGKPAMRFMSSDAFLAVEAGSVFLGAVDGGGSRLDLASGTGKFSAATFASIRVIQSMPATTFSDFGVLQIAKAADFTLIGSTSIATGQKLVVGGALTATGAIKSAGIVTLEGTVGGSGDLVISAGSLNLDAGTDLTIGKVIQSGGTATIAAAGLAYAGVWDQTGGAITASKSDSLAFTGAGDVFRGILSGTGAIAFTGGTDAFEGATLAASTMTLTAAAATLSGAITLSGNLTATTTDLAVAASGATLSSVGDLILTNAASNAIKGASASATLRNGATIEGAGHIGDGAMVLDNEAAGVIDGDDATALALDTGAATIANAGLIEATGAGGVTIASAVRNTGELKATGGSLMVENAVSGAGTVAIAAGGLADFEGAFNEAVTFTTSGELELADSQTYTQTISGFAKSGGTTLDLDDIAFGATTKATFSGTASGGTLRVTDGTHTAKVKLSGDYLAATFFVGSDGHGGTEVATAAIDSPAQRPAARLVGAAAFVAHASAIGPGRATAPGRDGIAALLAAPAVASLAAPAVLAN